MNYEELLYDLVNKNDRFIIMTAENRAAIRNLPSKIPDNFIDTGITEQTMIGMAAGLALRGRIPITHALATFLTMRAFEFIRTDVGIGNLPVKLVGGVPGFLSEANGPTHQAIEDVSIMRGIPGMNIFCPSDEADMMSGLPEVLSSDSPFYIRYNNLPNITEHSSFSIGKAEVFGDGKDVAILVYGMLFRQAFEAMEILKEKGIGAKVINLRTVKPIDRNTIISTLKNCGLTITLEDHLKTGGLFSIVSEILTEENIQADVMSLSLEDKWFKPLLMKDLLEYEGFSSIQVAEKIINKLKKNKSW